MQVLQKMVQRKWYKFEENGTKFGQNCCLRNAPFDKVKNVSILK